MMRIIRNKQMNKMMMVLAVGMLVGCVCVCDRPLVVQRTRERPARMDTLQRSDVIP